jgi:FdhD protein
MMALPDPLSAIAHVSWRHGIVSAARRAIAEEAAIAFTYDRAAYAVMMASPTNLDDFAIGFSLTEGIASCVGEIKNMKIVATETGIELRLSLDEARGAALIERRRYLAGPSGCGLCGVESLAQAMRPLPRISSAFTVNAAALSVAIGELSRLQLLNRQTHAVHAAAFWTPQNGIEIVREDVGRHNALDKLAGALACQGGVAAKGVILLTSRVSVEMIQKAAMIGAPIIAAISAPTALALRTAEKAGITVIAIARDDGFDVFTHPERVIFKDSSDAT